ncbi:HLA class II histocompatibility antigen, DM beta chain-like, partial [Anas platyrhynchos]|uniref:HLA class II histocompatibility antigen, DM beta chain-like n=1 Tax=Anas platyrhynchos TaxID=8839 RepID=UPI003AF21250
RKYTPLPNFLNFCPFPGCNNLPGAALPLGQCLGSSAGLAPPSHCSWVPSPGSSPITRGLSQGGAYPDLQGNPVSELIHLHPSKEESNIRNGTIWGAQPQVRIIPVETGNARVPVRLSCYIWGFYPPEVTVIWLHNGDIVEPDDYNPISAIPNGDWTYQTQVSLLVAPVAGDTYTCSVQHVSLQEPLVEDWSLGLMPEVTILVAVSTMLMVLGLGFFLAGVYCFRARPPAPGYTPLPGDNYPAGSI